MTNKSKLIIGIIAILIVAIAVSIFFFTRGAIVGGGGCLEGSNAKADIIGRTLYFPNQIYYCGSPTDGSGAITLTMPTPNDFSLTYSASCTNDFSPTIAEGLMVRDWSISPEGSAFPIMYRLQGVSFPTLNGQQYFNNGKIEILFGGFGAKDASGGSCTLYSVTTNPLITTTTILPSPTTPSTTIPPTTTTTPSTTIPPTPTTTPTTAPTTTTPTPEPTTSIPPTTTTSYSDSTPTTPTKTDAINKTTTTTGKATPLQSLPTWFWIAFAVFIIFFIVLVVYISRR